MPSPHRAAGPPAPYHDVPLAPVPQCPRCGARMGFLGTADDDTAPRYCGCCGLVTSAPTAEGRPSA